MDEAVICLRCGCAVGPMRSFGVRQTQAMQPTGTQTAAKVLMIIWTVFMAFFPLTLAWTLPLTLSYCGKIKRGERVGTGFKVCVLLFVCMIAGILLLCDKDEAEYY